MSESWDDYADEWDSNADAVFYASKAHDTLCAIVNPKGLNILDFGCGTGLLTERLAPAASRIVGLDTSEKMISVLNSKQLGNVDALSVELTQETLQTNPYLQRQFDLIVASSVCGFLPDYETTLQLLKALLKPKGVFVQWDWLNTGGASGFGLSKETVESAFINAGLEVSSISQAFSLESKEGLMPVLMGVAKNV